MRGEVVRVELGRLAVDRDRRRALVGLRQGRATVEEHTEGRRTVLLLYKDLRQAAVATVGRREMRHQIAKLLFRLAQSSALQALLARGEGDLVVEVSGAACQRTQCAPWLPLRELRRLARALQAGLLPL